MTQLGGKDRHGLPGLRPHRRVQQVRKRVHLAFGAPVRHLAPRCGRPRCCAPEPALNRRNNRPSLRSQVLLHKPLNLVRQTL